MKEGDSILESMTLFKMNIISFGHLEVPTRVQRSRIGLARPLRMVVCVLSGWHVPEKDQKGPSLSAGSPRLTMVK